MKSFKNRCIANYILFNHEPAIASEGLTAFYETVLRLKIKYLQRSYYLTEISVQSYLTNSGNPIIIYTFEAKSLTALEQEAALILLKLFNNDSIRSGIVCWRLYPKIIETERGFRCVFRLNIE